GLGVTKVVYLIAITLCFVLAACNVSKKTNHYLAPQIAAAWRAAAVATLIVVAASTLGIARGNSFTLVGQDAFTYMLLAVAPIMGLDGATSRKVRSFSMLVISIGVIAASAWSVWWLSLRGNQIGSLEQIALPTSFLGFAIFSITLTM
ncbi:TPA: hypothetical protein KKN05_004469, partial [Shigella flexneri]|nr:hypothetical protein [Shigella flexneri]